MFFTPELLAKRDSGFGLLWLAATLGSKSAFKKLPKRSVLTADISHLCELISQPVEPLALRLSSNLMFGAVRVYKVKQEIFMADVSSCVNSIKKVIQDIQNTNSVHCAQLMAQPTVRVSALNVTTDPGAAYALDFESLVADWDEYLNIGATSSKSIDDDSESAYDPSESRNKKKAPKKTIPPAEMARRDAYTLEEHHDHLLSASFELSFRAEGSGGDSILDLSSSQNDAFLSFDDNSFAFLDEFGEAGGELGDELAKELGWASSPAKSTAPMDVDIFLSNKQGAAGHGSEMDFHFDAASIAPGNDLRAPSLVGNGSHMTPHKAAGNDPFGGQALIMPICYDQNPESEQPYRKASVISSQTPISPATAFSRQLLSQNDDHPLPLQDITTSNNNLHNCGMPRKRKMNPQILLDARTELTDEELKVARAHYLEAQALLKHNIDQRKQEKTSCGLVEELIWGVPEGVKAKSLIEFWQKNFKIQVEARLGEIHAQVEERVIKRRKIAQQPQKAGQNTPYIDQDFDGEMGNDFEYGNFHPADPMPGPNQLRSSEEPGQGRQNSRASSIAKENLLGLDAGLYAPYSGSQRSSLFPWDHAGGSSSNGMAPSVFLGSGGLQVDHADPVLPDRSQSRRNSSLVPSNTGSMIFAGLSPAPGGTRDNQIVGEDYEFNVDAQATNEEAQDTQKSDLNLIALERNSFNFLEYAKMQYQTLPGPEPRLTFETVVPTANSTRHVAAAAFYHCLGTPVDFDMNFGPTSSGKLSSSDERSHSLGTAPIIQSNFHHCRLKQHRRSDILVHFMYRSCGPLQPLCYICSSN